VLSCYDRIIVTGTLPGACYAKGMTGFLSGAALTWIKVLRRPGQWGRAVLALNARRNGGVAPRAAIS
jgi:hypothetical protein